MSRLQDGSSDTNTTSFAPVTGYPFTMAVWFKQTSPSDSTVRNLIGIGTSGSNNNRASISVLGNGETNLNVRTTADFSINSGILANDTNWHLVVAVCASSTDRKLYTDSVTNVASDTNASAPSAFNRLRVGGNFTTPNLLFNGYTAHPAVWNVALSDDQLSQLFSRSSPAQVRPDALVFYVPFMGRDPAQASDADITSPARVLTANDATTASNDCPPVFWAPQERKGFLVSSAAGGVPSFSVAPTVQSKTAVAYTLSATPSTSATWYAAVTPAGTATPSVAQIKAGTGGGIVAAANKSVTGADTLVVGGSLTFPLYDIHSVLNNVSGDSSISSLTSQFLNPATGKQFMVFDVPLSGTAVESLVSASPAIADGDVWVIDTATTPGAYAVSVTNTGEMDVNVMGDTGRQLITHDVYDLSAQAYYGSGTIAINNQSPQVVGNPDEMQIFKIPKNTVLGPYDMEVEFSDPESDALTITIVDTAAFAALNLSIVSNDLGGTVPNVNSINTGLTVQAADPYGGTAIGDVTVIVGDVVVPDVVGLSDAAAISLLANGYLSGSVTSSIPSLLPAGTVLIQNPTALSEAAPDSVVSLTTSNGGIPAAPVKTRLSNRPKLQKLKRRRAQRK